MLLIFHRNQDWDGSSFGCGYGYGSLGCGTGSSVGADGVNYYGVLNISDCYWTAYGYEDDSGAGYSYGAGSGSGYRGE